MISKHVAFILCLLFATGTVCLDNNPVSGPVSANASAVKIEIGQIVESSIRSGISSMKRTLWLQEIKKNGLITAGVISGIFLLRLASNHQINEEFAVQARQYQEARAAAVAQQSNPNAGAIPGFWNWMKSVPGTTGSLFQATVPAFLANVIISKGWNSLQNVFSGPFQDASIEWYVQGHTHIKDSLSAITLNAATLDSDSFYLDFATNQMSQKVALQRFMQDVSQAVGHKDNFVRSFLPLKVARGYIRQSSHLDQLEDPALMIAGMKKSKQFVADGENKLELHQQAFARNAVHVFAKKLKIDMEKLLTFMVARYTQLSLKSNSVQWIIQLVNGYLSDVELLLNMSNAELTCASRENRGLFTKTFEFNKNLNDVLKTLQSELVWN